MARSKIEEELLAMISAQKQRTASEPSDTGLPDLPPGLFGEEPNAPRTKQASAASAMSPDAYMDFLRPPSPGRNVAEVGLDALWASAPAPQTPVAEDHLASLWSTPAPTAPAPQGDDQLSSLWATEPTAASNSVEMELQNLWDSPSRSTIADDAGDALSNLFMNRDAQAQAEMTGQPTEYGDIPVPQPRRAGEFNIEFDTEMNFESPARYSGGGARFRVDQGAPARTAFSGRVAASTDGVVVGQRGTNGRFQVTPQAPRATLSQNEAIRVYAERTAAAAPPAAPARPAATSATTTTYDVLSRGGLDI